MPDVTHGTIAIFKENAAKVSTTVVELNNLEEAASYALSLCSGRSGKVFAAPGLPEEILPAIGEQANKAGIKLVRQDLRACLKDIGVSFTRGDMALADTASVIMSNQGEDARLASMLSEVHVIAVPKAKVANGSYEAEDYLAEALAGTMYTTFISGCSRTSDIERVLTLGVHGPLELHVALITEE